MPYANKCNRNIGKNYLNIPSYLVEEIEKSHQRYMTTMSDKRNSNTKRLETNTNFSPRDTARHSKNFQIRKPKPNFKKIPKSLMSYQKNQDILNKLISSTEASDSKFYAPKTPNGGNGFRTESLNDFDSKIRPPQSSSCRKFPSNSELGFVSRIDQISNKISTKYGLKRYNPRAKQNIDLRSDVKFEKALKDMIKKGNVASQKNTRADKSNDFFSVKVMSCYINNLLKIKK